MIRSLILFTHVVGVLGLFAGLALEWLSLDGVRGSTLRAEALRWVRITQAMPRISGIALAVVVASGFYLGARVGVLGDAWLRASYALLLLMGIIGGPVTQPRMRVLQQAARDPGDIAGRALRAAASHWILSVSLLLRIAIGLAVVFLMISKPAAGGSLLVSSGVSVLAVVLAVAGRHDGDDDRASSTHRWPAQKDARRRAV